jgi:hypothetical protein
MVQVILKRADEPLREISRLLLDANYEVPAGSSTGVPASEYAEQHGLTAMIAQAVMKVAKLQPDDPLKEVGNLLSEGNDSATAAEALAKSLEKRPTADDLKEQGILKSPVEGKAAELGKAMAADALAKGLEKRPTADDLKEQGILKSPVEGKAVELEKAMAADALAKSLEKRPTMEEVEAKGIIQGGE